MSIIETSYQTSTLKKNNSQLEETLKLAINSNSLSPLSSSDNMLSNLLVITNDNGLLGDIASFNHPIKIETVKGIYYALDGRFFVRHDLTGRLKVKQPSDLTLNLLRLGLTKVWNEEEPFHLLHVSPHGLNTFSQWVARGFSNKLNPSEFYEFKAIVALYYFSRFSQTREFSESEKMSVARLITRFIKLPPEWIKELVESVGVIEDLDQLCEVIRTRIVSTRLSSLNKGVLISTLINGWFGIASKEIVASAIEFPVDWLALMFMSLTSRPHGITHIAKAVNAAVNPKEAASVARSIANTCDFDNIYSSLTTEL